MLSNMQVEMWLSSHVSIVQVDWLNFKSWGARKIFEIQNLWYVHAMFEH